MRFQLFLLSGVFMVVSAVVAAQEPVVSNVSFTPRTTVSGVVVDIGYDLVSPGGACTVTARLSTDGGGTFAQGVTTVSGDAGAGVMPGAGKHIRWEAWRDAPAVSSSSAVIQVTADVTPATTASYGIGFRDVVYVVVSRGNRPVAARIFYPATAPGEGVPFGGAAGVTFPVVVFGHGFVIPYESYDYVWESLTPRGYIVVMCDTETGISPNHAEYGLDLAFLAQKLRQEGASASSPFFSKVAPTAAIMGHSMGGGATLLAAQASDVDAIVTFSAAETSPSAVTAAGGVLAPALVFAGSADCVTPPEAHQIPMYEALGSAGKFLMTIENGSHCQFANGAPACELAENVVCPDATYISPTLQHAIVLDIVGAWLGVHLKGQASAWAAFDEAVEAYGASHDLTVEGGCEPTGIGASAAGAIDTSTPEGLAVMTPVFLGLLVMGLTAAAVAGIRGLRFGMSPPSCS